MTIVIHYVLFIITLCHNEGGAFDFACIRGQNIDNHTGDSKRNHYYNSPHLSSFF